MRAPATILLAWATLAPAPTLAASQGPKISLNGVNIDGVTNQRFENCTVTIDANGNVDIEARGYAARHGQPGTAGANAPLQPAPLAAAAPQPATPPPGPAPPANPSGEKVTRRYFLVTEQTRPDGTQFDIAVFVNAKWIRELKSNEEQVVTEVTKYLHPGVNKLVLAATKRITGERKSTSKDVAFRVIVGEGDAGGDHVMIDNPLVEMKRTAAETENITEEFTLVAR